MDLGAHRFAAVLGAEGRTVTFEADLPAEGVRLVKTFEVSAESYAVVIDDPVDGLERGGVCGGPFVRAGHRGRRRAPASAGGGRRRDA